MSDLAPWQVWWADLDPTKDREQAGRRPVVIVSSALHLGLVRGDLAMVAPITSRERPQFRHRVHVSAGPVPGWVITEQIRTISARRLLDGQPVATLSQQQIGPLRLILAKMVA